MIKNYDSYVIAFSKRDADAVRIAEKALREKINDFDRGIEKLRNNDSKSKQTLIEERDKCHEEANGLPNFLNKYGHIYD